MRLNFYRVNPADVAFHDVNRGSTQPTREFLDQIPTPNIRIRTPAGVPGGSWDPDVRPIKEWTRHLVAKLIEGKKKNRLLVMPSYTGRDIDVLKYHDVVADDCQWVCVERDKAVINYFERRAAETQLFDPRERVEMFDKYLHNYVNTYEPFDFAWIDLFGNIRWSELEYFSSNRHFTMRDMQGNVPDIDLFFTFGYRNAFRSTGDVCLKVIKNLLTDFGDRKHQGLATAFGIKEAVIKEYNKIKNSWRSYTSENCDNVDHRSFSRSCDMDDIVVTQVQLLKLIFNSYHGLDFDLKCYVYNDENHHEMILYHLDNFTPILDDSEYFGRFPIDMVYEMSRIRDKSDEDIAKELNTLAKKEYKKTLELTTNDVARWRKINNIARPEFMREFNMSLQLDQGLYVTYPEEEDPPQEQWANILLGRLYEFNPWIKTFADDGEIKIKTSAKGIRIATDTCKKFDFTSYSINVDKETVFKSTSNITVNPQYLHKDNRSALFSVFRIMFVGDPYLHPQLINDIDKDLFTLSEPQEIAISSWVTRWNRGEKAGAIVLPTGMGKTTVAINILRRFLHPRDYPEENIREANCTNTSCRILFLAHQAEILDQAIERMVLNPKDGIPVFDAEDVGVAYDKSYNQNVAAIQRSRGSWRDDRMTQLSANAVFASVDSLIGCINLIPSNHFDFIVIDEAHHTPARTWATILEHFSNQSTGQGPAYILGLTATPFRYDEQNVLTMLGNNEIYKLGFKRGFFMGYLSWPEYELFPDRSMRRRKKTRKRVDPTQKMVTVARIYNNNAGNLKTVGFCKSVEQAVTWAEYFNNTMGIRSAALHDDTPRAERTNLRRRFKLPLNNPESIQILFVKDLFNEGVDVPDIEAILFLRSTKSPVKHFQQLGRGLRLAKGKRRVKILDFESNYPDNRALLDTAIFLDIVKPHPRKPGGGIGEPPDEDDLSLVPYVTDRRGIRIIVENTLRKSEKRHEAALFNKLYDYRIIKQLSYAEIKQQKEFVGVRNETLASDIREIDKETPKTKRNKVIEVIHRLHSLISGYRSINMSPDEMYSQIARKSTVKRNVFDEILGCVDSGLNVIECANKVLKTSKRNLKKRKR